MEQKKKIGLVVEGGGMKCAYNAGILDAFLDRGITFDYCIGVSGGAGNVASFVAGQRGRNLRFFTDHIHSPKYFGIKSLLKTGNLFGLQYIYGELTNSAGKDPRDFAAIMKNPIKYEVVATNALTGKAKYFGKEDMKQDDYRPI
ncbi:MAG TPA: patatin family protein, partial [Candidatus Mediterraneibacter stercoripullorum]|nr:patatin family protein [Candidatus Mediterraneibacter stercoripullorum]